MAEPTVTKLEKTTYGLACVGCGAGLIVQVGRPPGAPVMPAEAWCPDCSREMWKRQQQA